MFCNFGNRTWATWGLFMLNSLVSKMHIFPIILEITETTHLFAAHWADTDLFSVVTDFPPRPSGAGSLKVAKFVWNVALMVSAPPPLEQQEILYQRYRTPDSPFDLKLVGRCWWLLMPSIAYDDPQQPISQCPIAGKAELGRHGSWFRRKPAENHTRSEHEVDHKEKCGSWY